MVSLIPSVKSRPFSKYQGAGNDFIVLDNRKNIFTVDRAEIKKLCHRRLGIGADGIIWLTDSKTADFGMRIFNADGSEAEMCGNGVRCLAAFLRRSCISTKEKFSLETMQRQLTVTFQGSIIEVEMGAPTHIARHTDLTVLNTGVPHAVIFNEKIEALEISRLGPEIRYHARFAPQGVNVNFVEKIGPSALAIRTYERGVEAETLACGTGCTAAAIAAHLVLEMPSPITVKTASDELLTISFTPDFQDVKMAGNATFVFEGHL
ncbi:MAG: diaminopimelate epimerase [Chlamydiota bacterium]